MPQLTLDIIQTPENAFAIHPQNQLLFFFSFLSFSLLNIVWHICERDVMANEKQIEGNFVWWQKGDYRGTREGFY